MARYYMTVEETVFVCRVKYFFRLVSARDVSVWMGMLRQILWKLGNSK